MKLHLKTVITNEEDLIIAMAEAPTFEMLYEKLGAIERTLDNK